VSLTVSGSHAANPSVGRAFLARWNWLSSAPSGLIVACADARAGCVVERVRSIRASWLATRAEGAGATKASCSELPVTRPRVRGKMRATLYDLRRADSREAQLVRYLGPFCV
jgi:hypothetical protein